MPHSEVEGKYGCLFRATCGIGSNWGVGQSVARILSDQGAWVRAVNRGGHPVEDASSAEVIAADLMNRKSALAACQGASVIYHCAGLPYSQWATAFPGMLDNIIAAASDIGATLVYTDNCYMYAPSSQPLTEDSPQQPTTRKGRVRKQLADTLLAAHAQGRVRATIGRASDFYGPGVRSSMVGEQVFGALVRGKRVPWLGKLDAPHTFSYVEDFARGLITLGSSEQALGQVWHIPAAPALTGKQFLTLAGDVAEVRVRPLPISGTMTRVLGLLTTPVLRETVELLYEYTEPYFVDGSKYASTFGGTPTDHRESMRQTVAWYRQSTPGAQPA
jgi:nucleoside-diphosphate-sugar epimerase